MAEGRCSQNNVLLTIHGKDPNFFNCSKCTSELLRPPGFLLKEADAQVLRNNESSSLESSPGFLFLQERGCQRLRENAPSSWIMSHLIPSSTIAMSPFAAMRILTSQIYSSHNAQQSRSFIMTKMIRGNNALGWRTLNYEWLFLNSLQLCLTFLQLL